MLGFVSMLMDISSEMIHALLPVYLVTVLGASTLTVGFIEGVAEATASITKIFSGALSDWLGRRKLLAALGYGLAAVTKPLFPLAPSIGWLVAARFIDRVGKGIRGAPRDALIADIAPAGLRGASFGLRQSLDTVGAFVGPLAAIGLMWWTADHFAAVFWVAVVPAFLSFGLIAFAVNEPEPDASREPAKNPLNTAAMRQLGPVYWRVVAIGVVFTLARFSEAFLILRAQNIGLNAMWVPAVLVLMNITYALSAYPAGVLSDRINRTALLALGLVFLAGADLALALLPSSVRPRARRRAVGSAYGIDARLALGPRRRYCTSELARHRIRLFQPVHGPCAAGRERDCRRAVGRLRPGRHVPRRARLRAGRTRGTAHRRQRAGNGEQVIMHVANWGTTR